MERIYSEPSPILIYHLRDVLGEKGIPTIIKNEFLSGGVGELPPTEVWPELWVVDKKDGDVAQRIVQDFIQSTQGFSEDWVCAACGEHVEGQFKVCWNCGSAPGTD